MVLEETSGRCQHGGTGPSQTRLRISPAPLVWGQESTSSRMGLAGLQASVPGFGALLGGGGMLGQVSWVYEDIGILGACSHLHHALPTQPMPASTALGRETRHPPESPPRMLREARGCWQAAGHTPSMAKATLSRSNMLVWLAF